MEMRAKAKAGATESGRFLSVADYRKMDAPFLTVQLHHRTAGVQTARPLRVCVAETTRDSASDHGLPSSSFVVRSTEHTTTVCFAHK